MNQYINYLESAIDGTQLPAGELYTIYKGRPIWVRYDLSQISTHLTKTVLAERPATMWRYSELLPMMDQSSIVSLGEGMTPIINCERLGAQLKLENLCIKDDSQLPTGSFKSRGQSTAITMAKHFGIQRVAIPTAGNAGGAMAAYAARAGLEAYVFMPKDTPKVNQIEACLAGARVFLVNGLITDCAKIVKDGMETMGWFDLSTLKEPYRLEGKKTMGLELAEQLAWNLPDVIIYPTGGGTGLIGMWKAFQELSELGWLNVNHFPRMVAVQSDGCCPIVRAYEKNERFAEFFENAHTIASGLRVPAAVGDFMILDVIRESNGCAVAVDERRILEWMKLTNSVEGVAVGPEAAACVGAAQQLSESGWIKSQEQVVIFNCGAAQKYTDIADISLPMLDKNQEIDWAIISN